jgi:hypothetical protein
MAHRLQPGDRMTNLNDQELESIDGGDFIIGCAPWDPDYPLGAPPPQNPFPGPTFPPMPCW